MVYNKFIMPVRADICREISKRRVYSHRKDQETGEVKKRKNPKGTSSPFGWGTVGDTFMLNVKSWDNVRRNLDLYVKQVDACSYLEKSPRPKKRQTVAAPTNKTRVPPLIEEWYNRCNENLAQGSVGLVPDCWATLETMPPLEELIVTQIGKTLLNFNRFIKQKF